MQSRPTPQDFGFDIAGIQTATFPIPRDPLTRNKNRRFFVSVSDGTITKDTRMALLEGQSLNSLHWSDTLDGFTIHSSSLLALKVIEKHDFRSNNLLATFHISYEMLRAPANEFLVQSADDNSKKKKSPTREIKVILSDRRIILDSGVIPVAASPKARYTADDTIPASSPSDDKTNDLRSRVQEIRHNADKVSSLTPVVVSASDDIGNGLDATEKAITFANDFLEKWKTVSDRLAFVVSAVDTIAEIHPYAKLAWTVISFIPTKISEQIELDNDVMGLLDAIEDALDLTPDSEKPDGVELKSRSEQSTVRRKTIERLMDLITECAYFIQSYVRDVSFCKRLIKNSITNKKEVITRFQEQLQQLRDAFIAGLMVDVDINVLRVLDRVESIDLELKFPLLQGARFNPEKRCLPGTRVKFLEEIVNWLNVNPLSPRALILFGQAGTGKSSIAHEIASQFHEMERLTASYCFIRGKPSSREPHRFFTTLAHELSARYPAFKASLGAALKKDPSLHSAEDYTTLFKSLIVEPLKDVLFCNPVFIVIDALDECEDASSGSLHSGIPFHTFLGKHLSELPSNFRILITSRPEPDIVDAFPKSSSVRPIQMDDPQLADGVHHDIRTYMQSILPKGSIGANDLEKLVTKAEGLFQWAHVACEYIANRRPGLSYTFRLQETLDSTGHLDDLYSTVLKANFDMKHLQVRRNFQSVMQQVLGTLEPLSITSLNTMRQHAENDTNVSDIVEFMGSLLSNVTPPDSTLPIAPLHTSFRDYLTDQSRSKEFYVDLNDAHRPLVYATLRTMQNLLQFNICKLETSYRLNSEVSDLEKRIEQYIPQALSYSCRFWADRLVLVADSDDDLLDCIRMLMEKKFLFWLEILSLMGGVAIASNALSALSRWLGQIQVNVLNKGIHTLDALVQDALAFVRYFGYPIAQSAPHIYLSSLPFAPSSSLIAKLYSSQFPCTLNIKHGRLTQWPALVMSISAPIGRTRVCCVAWSPNDEHIAAGLKSGHVFIWNASTGTKVSSLLATTDVLSVAFSQNGPWLASGCLDGDIFIWKLTTTGQDGGQKKVLKGQAGAVSALSFSPDGDQLVSGLGNGNVQIWDLKREMMVAEFSDGPRISVWAVSFLPDSKYILSRSGSRKVQVWNLETKQKVINPFEQVKIPTGTVHSNYCQYSVRSYGRGPNGSSFTPCPWTEAVESEEREYMSEVDNTRIPVAAFSRHRQFVSTCGLQRIHVWHVNGELAGKLVGGPFSRSYVTSLAFSWDGKRITSGSDDGMVHVWNVVLVEDEVDLEVSEVTRSIVFTPDHQQIAVASDEKLQMLDVATGKKVVRIRDKGPWRNIAFSPNGDLIGATSYSETYIFTLTGEEVARSIWSRSGGFFSSDSNDIFVFESKTKKTIYLLNMSTGTRTAMPMQIDDVVSICSSTATARVVVGTYDGKIIIWHTDAGVSTGPFIHTRDVITVLVFTPDGRHIIFVTSECDLYMLDSTTGNTVTGPLRLRNDQMYPKSLWPKSISWMGNERIRVACNEQDGLRSVVFDVVNHGDSGLALQGSLAVLASHTRTQYILLDLSKDGQFLATGSEDGAIKIWDLQAVAKYKHTLVGADDSEIGNINEAYFKADGWLVCTSSRGGPPLHLFWVPEMHRKLLNVGGGCMRFLRDDHRQKETQVHHENFVHGRDWVRCQSAQL